MQRIHGVVVKRGWLPRILGVTLRAIGRELVDVVIRVGGGIIISNMTTRTRIRSIRIARAVAAVAVVGNACMSAMQRINRVMVKAGRHP